MVARPIHPLPDYRKFKFYVRLVVLVLILITISFSVWKSVDEYTLTVEGAHMKTRGYASALKEHAERAFSEADTALKEVLEHFERHGGLISESPEQIRKTLETYRRNNPLLASIILVNRDGLLYAHSLDVPVKQAQVSDRDYFIFHRDNPDKDIPFVSRPLKSRVNGKWRITLSRPMRDSKGAFAGLVAVALDLDYFRTFYASLDLGKKGKIVMIRRDGVLLVAQPFQESDYKVDFKNSHLIKTYLPKSDKGTFQIAGGKALLDSGGRIISYDSLKEFPVVANANMGLGEVTSEWLKNTIIQAVITVLMSFALWVLAMVLLRQVRRIEEAYEIQLEQQHEIAESGTVWQSTFDAVGDAIWVMDLNRQILRANTATHQIFGRHKEMVIGHLCCEVAHKGNTPLETCPFQRMLDSGHRASMQLCIDRHWYDVSVDPVTNDANEIIGAVHIVSDITDIKSSEEAALENEARMLALLSAIPDAIFFKDGEGRWLLANHAGIELFGLRNVEYHNKTDLELAEMAPAYREAFVVCQKTDQDAWSSGALYMGQEIIPAKDGSQRIFDTVKIPLYKTNGTRSGLVVVGRDITDQHQMEQQLRQAQKMEAIGHLAGGIAHDFNNLLTPILGYAEMIAARLSPNDPLNSKINGISAAAHKAKDLTHQLLSFGRRQLIETRVIDVNEIIESFHIILRRTIKESITIKLALDPNGACITADRSQIEQIILNMTVNAQDALQGKGIISIETCQVHMEGENVRMHPGMVEGDYILLAFHDNGCGMNPHVLAHIFEPFYTTKAVGHGTGLGLATVYGIVKQHFGYISVSSREGEGTTFRIYFPQTTVVPLESKQDEIAQQTSDISGQQTLLVVEDNEMVRDMVQEMLEGYGYTALVASDADEALEIAAENSAVISMMISDIVMPGMNGPELYDQLLEIIPGLKVVFISGYPMNPSLRGGTLEEEVGSYLQKPFTAEALLERIRMVLK